PRADTAASHSGTFEATGAVSPGMLACHPGQHHWLGRDASPSAVAMTRNTRVLSMRPWNISAPGPVAVSTTSSAECTPALAANGRLPVRRALPGTLQYFSLATLVFAVAPGTAGTFSPSR